MDNGTSYPFDFVGGHYDIKAPSPYTAKDGMKKISPANVDLSKIVDKWGRCTPQQFLNLVNATITDKKAMNILEELSKLA